MPGRLAHHAVDEFTSVDLKLQQLQAQQHDKLNYTQKKRSRFPELFMLGADSVMSAARGAVLEAHQRSGCPRTTSARS